jgi:hypothetical protein
MALVNVVVVDGAFREQIFDVLVANGPGIRMSSVRDVETAVTWAHALSLGASTGGNTPIISSGDTLYFAGPANGIVDAPVGITFNVNANPRIVISNAGVGFNGGGTLNRPTVSGSRGGNAALGSLLGVLAAMGLITDGTTA